MNLIFSDSDYKNIISLLLGSHFAHVTHLSFQSKAPEQKFPESSKKYFGIQNLTKDIKMTSERLGKG